MSASLFEPLGPAVTVLRIHYQHLDFVLLVEGDVEVSFMLGRSHLHVEAVVLDTDVIQILRRERVFGSESFELVAVVVDQRNVVGQLLIVICRQVFKVGPELLGVAGDARVAEVGVDVVADVELVLRPDVHYLLPQLLQRLVQLASLCLSLLQALFEVLNGVFI